MKIFVAMPVFDGKLQVQTVQCLLAETLLAAGLGDELRVNFLPTCSVPAAGRNQLVQDFLDSDCDRMFFLDSDITWVPGDLLKMCHMPKDVVGACYRFKCPQEEYPIDWLDKTGTEPLQADELGLLQVAKLPTGFLAISREAFEKFMRAYPNRHYVYGGRRFYSFFQMYFRDGALYSDDAGFCKEWVDAGQKIFLDPRIPLVHWDSQPTPFAGNIGAWLRRNAGLPVEVIQGEPECEQESPRPKRKRLAKKPKPKRSKKVAVLKTLKARNQRLRKPRRLLRKSSTKTARGSGAATRARATTRSMA